MIIKNLTRKQGGSSTGQLSSIGQLIKYVLRYTVNDKKQLERNAASLLLTHNIVSKDIQGMIQEFKDLQKKRVYKRKDQVALHHSVLSLHPKDARAVSDKMLKDIAKKYIRLRADNALWIVSVHRDRQHIHLHCVISSTYLNGKSHRLSKAQFGDLKVALENYQQKRYPELIHSHQAHEKRNQRERLQKVQQLPTYQTGKGKVVKATHQAYEQATSLEDFLTRLKTHHLSPYYRGIHQVVTGVTINGKNYRFKTLGIDTEMIGKLKDREPKIKYLEELKQIRQRANERAKEQSLERSRWDYKPKRKSGGVGRLPIRI